MKPRHCGGDYASLQKKQYVWPQWFLTDTYMLSIYRLKSIYGDPLFWFWGSILSSNDISISIIWIMISNRVIPFLNFKEYLFIRDWIMHLCILLTELYNHIWIFYHQVTDIGKFTMPLRVSVILILIHGHASHSNRIIWIITMLTQASLELHCSSYIEKLTYK